ncbi:profilin [Mycena galopus ATCC 62051]|nr:profilin [Mycena galopus ATCC 62051]
MSDAWKPYVDTNLVGTGKISKAAILGKEGGVWASSPGYTLSDGEQKVIKDALKGGDECFSDVRSNGVKLAGVKFIITRAQESSIYAKKQSDGVIIVGTTQAVLIGEYVAPVQAAEAAGVVEDLAKYLIGLGY